MASLQNPSSSAPYLLKLISEQRLDPGRLTTHQRRVCIRFLLQEGKYAQYEIGAILHVHESQVSRDKKHIQAQNAWVLDELDERKIAVQLIQTAEVAAARLFRKDKERDAWTVERELVETLQSLGYLKRAPIDIGANPTLTEILKLAAADPKDETFLGRSGPGSKALTNGSP